MQNKPYELPVKTSWLKKKGSSSQKWCALYPHYFTWFSNKTSAKLAKAVQLHSVVVRPISKGGSELCFGIYVGQPHSREYVFKCQSEQQREEWVSSILTAQKNLQHIKSESKVDESQPQKCRVRGRSHSGNSYTLSQCEPVIDQSKATESTTARADENAHRRERHEKHIRSHSNSMSHCQYAQDITTSRHARKHSFGQTPHSPKQVPASPEQYHSCVCSSTATAETPTTRSRSHSSSGEVPVVSSRTRAWSNSSSGAPPSSQLTIFTQATSKPKSGTGHHNNPPFTVQVLQPQQELQSQFIQKSLRKSQEQQPQPVQTQPPQQPTPDLQPEKEVIVNRDQVMQTFEEWKRTLTPSM